MEKLLVDVGGRNLAVTIDGQGENMIVFLHGLTGHQHNFYHLVQLLKEDFKTVTVDLAGRGESDPAEKSSVPQHAKDIQLLLEKLAIDEPILIGHSMGAFITSIIASEHPHVKGAVYLDGACKVDPILSMMLQPSLSRLQKTYETKEQYLQEMRLLYTMLGITWSEEIEQAVLYEVVETDGIWKSKMNARNINEDLQGFADYNPKAIAGKVKCPVLLVIATGMIGPLPALFAAPFFEDTKDYTKNIETFVTPSNHYTMVGVHQPELNQVIYDIVKSL
ncbi:alpha/beta fold hydrolase [Lysinibacillus sp. NPDC097287]|uniref:alpha/beta fold hydrolase n=1 Tax=Lysinibacillus sp. NPDC097287 TaxID=3364144 RepID=UPI0038166357